MRKKILIQVLAQYLKEDDTVVVYCQALELCGYGKTLKEAHKDFQKAVQIFLEETAKMGTLAQALTQLGWRKIRAGWRPPFEVIQSTTEEIALPA